MATACIPQITFGFEPQGKPIVAAFDQPHASSDGGAVLLKSLDTQVQLTKRLAGCLVDTPAGQGAASDLGVGAATGLSGSRVATPTATTPPGWPTMRCTSCCSTAIRSRGRALASQPTLSRFENAVAWAPLRDMAYALADTVIETHRRRLQGRATRITIDLDPTDDPTHGSRSPPSSTATTTRRATCRWSRR